MRMGRPNKKWRSSSKKQQESPDSTSPTSSTGNKPPKYSSPTLVVGQVSSNVIHSILSPALTSLATQSVEKYADEVMRYEALVAESNLRLGDVASVGAFEHGDRVEIDPNGDIHAAVQESNQSTALPPLTPPSAYRLFTSQSDIDELASLLASTSRHFSAPSNKWKTHVNAAKFERLLDEKYGRFRPFITAHPELEALIKNVQRKYAMGEFSPFRKGDPPMGRTTSIMILFMMHRNGVRVEGVVLAALFLLVGLRPWALVALVCFGRWLMERRRKMRMAGVPRKLVVCDPYYARSDDEVYNGSDDNGKAKGKAESDHGNGEDDDEEAETRKKYQILERPVGTKFNAADLSLRDERHDVILLGSGPDVLYTAALLARVGRKVLVLSPREDASGCVSMSSTSSNTYKSMENQRKQSKLQQYPLSSPSLFSTDKIPFDIDINNISHLSKQQALLTPALVTNSDTQGGIRFARIGSHLDSYSHSILSVPGLGTDSTNPHHAIPVVITSAGPRSLAEYAANHLGDGYPGQDLDGNDDGNSTSLGYLHACRQINAGSGEHYLSKLFGNADSSSSTSYADSSNNNNAYQQATIRPTSAFLNKCLPLNTHVRSLMAALGMANENLSPDQTSMAAHVSNICAMTSEEGMAYPVGGPRALSHALVSVIEQCGGRVVTGVPLQELLFEEKTGKELEKSGMKAKLKMVNKKKSGGDEGNTGTTDSDIPQQLGENGPKPRCRGVRLENGLEITVTAESDNSSSSSSSAVISMLGFIPTFLHLFPSEIRTTHGVPRGLAAVSERRPVMKILVGIEGSKEELNLTGADWYRLPNATLPRDELDPLTGQVKFGIIGVSSNDGNANEDRDAEDVAAAAVGEASGLSSTLDESTGSVGNTGNRGKRSKSSTASSTTTATTNSTSGKTHRTKFTSGVSWMKVSFPSAKDPSWFDRHGSITTCVVTIEADDDFVRMFDTQPKIYSIIKSGAGDMERLRERVLKDLVDNFPQLDGKILCTQVQGPLRSGLTHDPARFAIKGNRPQTPYPNLFIGGSDLTIGDSFSGSIVGGWMAANAVMGYSFIDHLYLKKNITSDLEQFLEEPCFVNERNGVIVEDVAVPFKELEFDYETNSDCTKEKESGYGEDIDRLGCSAAAATAESSREE
mmetsp:Transcript_33047/g.64646  ORF Transcript_33047/g.64646 Transcript_33047/m.64646 type:complete len:1144 (-) Transcript_33047:74-3505(-)